jgi:hypothetical protein
MLKIEASRVSNVRTAARAQDLYEHLQGAIQLEHATIPVYLSALFSLKPGAMTEIANTLSSIVIEEMLHMAIACNVFNAIGGAPSINTPAFVPRYPGPLPMSINTGLIVHLGPLSLERIKDEFLEIEEPETPLIFPTAAVSAAAEFATIGQFYRALEQRIAEMGDAIFIGDPARQVTGEQWFPADELFAVHDAASATRALGLIVEQGEGTTTSPLNPEGTVAHYYRFQEIIHGRRLVSDGSVEEGFSYTGDTLTFDPTGVAEMAMDATADMYAPGTRARILCDQFNFAYTSLLNTLHLTFNGRPDALNDAMGLMFELKVLAANLTTTPIAPESLRVAAPSFEFVP